jgi:hypothetical protein
VRPNVPSGRIAVLTSEEKHRLRLEEIYREEVRREIHRTKRSNKVLSFLNTPLGLYILSGVFIGSLSFLYTRWSESQATKHEYSTKIASAKEEAIFRTKQVDSVLGEVTDKGAALVKKAGANAGVLHGDEINAYVEEVPLVMAAIKLSGIVNFPPSQEEGDKVLVGTKTTGYSVRSLPFKRGFKDPQYQNYELKDLMYYVARLQSKKVSDAEKSHVDRLFSQLNNIADYVGNDITYDWYLREQALDKYKAVYGDAYRVNKMDVPDYADQVKQLHQWVLNVANAWNQVKKERLFENLQR